MRTGIICDLGYARHTQFKSYYYAIETLLGTPKIVNSVDDLVDVELLVIGDDHFQPHKNVWQQPLFIETCNERNIKVLVMTDEKIFGSFFPWNEGNYRVLKFFKNLYHHAIDVDDCKKLGITITRVAPSHRFVANTRIVDIPPKDKILFIGNTGGSYYKRNAVIEELSHTEGIDFVMIPSSVPSWEELIRLFSEYRFVLSPIGNGNFFTSRFYEILLAGSIPIHQVLDDTLDFYAIEAQYDDCIFFKDVKEIKRKIDACSFDRSHNRFYMEDNLKIILKQDGLL